jgi:hypothetical protein
MGVPGPIRVNCSFCFSVNTATSRSRNTVQAVPAVQLLRSVQTVELVQIVPGHFTALREVN